MISCKQACHSFYFFETLSHSPNFSDKRPFFTKRLRLLSRQLQFSPDSITSHHNPSSFTPSIIPQRHFVRGTLFLPPQHQQLCPFTSIFGRFSTMPTSDSRASFCMVQNTDRRLLVIDNITCHETRLPKSLVSNFNLPSCPTPASTIKSK